MQSRGSRHRVVVEHVTPQVDCGRFPAKGTVGHPVEVRADVFGDGHDRIGAVLRWRCPDGPPIELAMHDLGNDRWSATVSPDAPGLHRFWIQGWVDGFATWRADLLKRLGAGQDLEMELRVGAPMVAAAVRRADGEDAERLRAFAQRLRRPKVAEAAELATSEELAALMERYGDRGRGAAASAELAVWVDRPRATFGSWYELFPRSAGSTPGRHGTFRDVAALVPELAEAGFDVLYLPPIHPIGTTARKGRDNATSAGPDDPGSPWAIGDETGGHTAIHPALGDEEDLRGLVATLADHGMELAMDLAFQASPDHPWVREHPDWFRHLPDGSIRPAENPPKRYEDIYPLDFETRDHTALWRALLEVVTFWLDRGVRIFRVDNPHTKPFAFWEWLIDAVHARDPGVLFLAEAFTRPRVMERLAKLGFSQSYTYFTWRTSAAELTGYFTELSSPPVADFLRPNLWPNTPDILHETLQVGGPAAFRLRLLLAATLGANYGVYGPAFEHLEQEPREPGSEEYARSEKYEIRTRSSAAGPMRELLTRLNAIRRRHPALQQDRRLTFHPTDNPELLAYSKRDASGDDVILAIVNLDPDHPQAGFTDLSTAALGLAAGAPFTVRDLLTEQVFAWHGARNYVELRPAVQPGHVLHVRAEPEVSPEPLRGGPAATATRARPGAPA
jgi:starch synthase (maltosyl-transferring)